MNASLDPIDFILVSLEYGHMDGIPQLLLLWLVIYPQFSFDRCLGLPSLYNISRTDLSSTIDVPLFADRRRVFLCPFW